MRSRGTFGVHDARLKRVGSVRDYLADNRGNPKNSNAAFTGSLESRSDAAEHSSITQQVIEQPHRSEDTERDIRMDRAMTFAAEEASRLSSNRNLIPAVKRWAFRAVLAVLGLVVVLALAGFAYQQISVAKDFAEYPASGQMVSVGDHKLRLDCRGKGSPTVLLEAGLGATSDGWSWVQRDLQSITRVCFYDRAGLGYSEAASAPQDAAAAADDLYRLLTAAQIKTPVVVAGHSYGGLVARVFAQRYPRSVAGLVLVDSAHEDMGERFPPAVRDAFRQLLNGFALLNKLSLVGLPRVMGVPGQLSAGLAGDAKGRALAVLGSRLHLSGSADEASLWEFSAAEARAVKSLGDLPLTVMMAGGWPAIMKPSWLAMQKELAAKSRDSRFVTVQKSDHPGMIQREQYAQQVAREIARIVAKVQTSNVSGTPRTMNPRI